MLINTNILKRELAEKIDQAKELHELAKKEQRSFTSGEERKYNDLMSEIDRRKDELLKAERDNETEMSGGEQPAALRGAMAWGQNESRTIKNPKTYRSMFYRNEQKSLDKGKFDNWADFAGAIASQRHDPRLQELRFQQGSVGQLGGFSIPSEFGSFLLDAALEDEVIRPRANVHAMQSNEKHIPAWDGLDRGAGGMFGGLQGQWLAELEEATPEVATLRLMTLKANKLAIFSDISSELMHDSQDFADQLKRAMVQAIGYSLDHAFINSAGAGSPLGLLNDPALIQIPRTGFPSAAPGDNYTDLVGLYNALYKGGPGVANWLVHPSVVPELITMTDALGNLIWHESAREAAPGRMFGLPVVISEKLPGIGDPGCIILANLNHYQVGMCRDIYIDTTDTGPGWLRDYRSFRTIVRVDGQGGWDKPATRPDGGQESWVVALQ